MPRCRPTRPDPLAFPATHPEWEALLRRIRADPGDATARLVAADWLDDSAPRFPLDAAPGCWTRRAEFIRRQCECPEGGGALAKEVARLDYVVWASEACPALVRVEWPRYAMLCGSVVGFRRGFAETLRCRAVEWKSQGRAIRERAPIRELHLTRGDQLTNDDWWELLPSLKSLDSVRVDGLDEFAERWLAERLAVPSGRG